MKLNNAVLRLIQAGDENSAAWQKIGESINKLAETLAMYFPGGGEINDLPGGVGFQHWPSGEYCFQFQSHHSGIGAMVMRDGKYRDFVLDLCEIIAEGWLDEVSAFLEKETRTLVETEQGINKFAGKD